MDDISNLIEKGKEYIHGSEYKLAGDIFLKVLKKEPDNEEAHFELGKIYSIQKRNDLAIKELDKAIKVNKNNIYAMILSGKIYKSEKKYEESREMFDKALKSGCKDEDIKKELNEVEIILRRYRAARERDGFKIATKGFRKDIPPFRACATWLITNKCNYRCSYCLDSHEDTEGFNVLTPKEWSAIWKKLYDKYGTMAIQVTGGEPAFYPGFFEVLKQLSKMHNFDIQTNLFWDPEEIIEKVPPERISRIGGSFHLEYTEFEPFLKKIVTLKEAGYNVEINFVAYPPYLDKTLEYLNMAQKEEIQFSILSFQGEYEGRTYPQEYNDKEREMLKNFNIFAGESTLSMAQWDVEHKTPGERKEAAAPLRKCRMGQMYTWIKSNGEAMRCCKTSHVLGNIITGTFNLLDEAIPCNMEDCMCWRNMTLGEEDRWSERWPGTEINEEEIFERT